MIMLNRTNKWFCEEADEVSQFRHGASPAESTTPCLQLDIEERLSQRCQRLKGIHRQQASDRAQKRQETYESSLWTRQSLLQLSAKDHVAPQILADDKSKTNIRDYIWKFIKTCKDRQGALSPPPLSLYLYTSCNPI